MKEVQKIPCPNCQTPIPFDVNQLLKGSSFSCPNCNSKIALSSENKSTVQDALDKFDELKNKLK